VRALAVIALLAACGGGKAAAPRQDDPRSTTVEAAPLTHEQHLAALDDLATRGCACADAACGRAVDADLAELIGKVAIGSAAMPEEQATPGAEAMIRYLGCLAKLGVEPEASLHTSLVARLDDVADAACACRDLPCAEQIWGGLVPEVMALGGLVGSNEGLRARVQPTWSRLEECLDPLNAQASAQAVVDLTALRDAGCACQDAACADGVQARFDAFLMEHRNTKGSEEDAVKVGALAEEMQTCLAAARATP